VERPVASAAYSFLRFAGGAIAPWLAGKLAEWFAADVPFFVGAGAVLVALGTLLAGRRHLVEAPEGEEAVPVPARAPVLVAVDAGAGAGLVTAAAARLAAERGVGVEVLHVRETDVLVGEDAADLETRERAHAALEDRLAQLREAGVPAGGEVLRSVGTHEDAARAVLDRLAATGAGTLVVGAPARHAGPLGHSHTTLARQRAGVEVVEVREAAAAA
jgi:hypothetical protein